jgi:hypothetical protein
MLNDVGVKMDNNILKVHGGQGFPPRPNKPKAGPGEGKQMSINLARYVLLLCLIFLPPACGTYSGYGGFYPYDSYYPYDYSYPYYYYPYYSYPDGYYYYPDGYRDRDHYRHKEREEHFERQERGEHFGGPGEHPGGGGGFRRDGVQGGGRGEHR